MILALLVVVTPFAAAGALAAVPGWRSGGRISVGASALTFLLCCGLPWTSAARAAWTPDPLGAHFAMLTAFAGLCAAWFALTDAPTELFRRTLDPGRARLFPVAYQCFTGGVLGALLSHNLALSWIATALAVLAATAAIALPRAEAAIEAAWSFALIAGVGLLLSVIGAAALYLAAIPAPGTGAPVLDWASLLAAAGQCHAPLLNLAFVFLLLGAVALAGLAPLHLWVTQTSVEAPAPLNAVLSCAMANIGLLTVLRLRALAAAQPDAIAPGPPIIALGLISMLTAAVALWRTPDLRRFLAYAALGQTGAATVAIGLGGEAASFAALLQLTAHTLTRVAAQCCAARAIQLKGVSEIAEIGGLIATHRALGLTLLGCLLAITPVPPFALFSSLFLILTDAMRQSSAVAALLAIGVGGAGGAALLRLPAMCFGAPTRTLLGLTPRALELAPVWVCLGLLAALGVLAPRPVAEWMHALAPMAR